MARQLHGKLAPHLRLPLRHQGRRRQDQHRASQSPHEQFGEDQPRFHRFSQADFIAEQRPPAKPSQDGDGGASLMLQQFHLPHHRQRDELIEAMMRRQACRANAQFKLCRADVVRRAAQQLDVGGVNRQCVVASEW